MVDRISKESRSHIMRSIPKKDTKPERIVRSVLHRLGYRFRKDDSRLPGRPDAVLKRHNKTIFVHGCFWHQHRGCKKVQPVGSNKQFWEAKLQKNRERDARVAQQLIEDGWSVVIVWECATECADASLAVRLKKAIESKQVLIEIGKI